MGFALAARRRSGGEWMSNGLVALVAMVCFIPFSLYLCHRLPRASAISVVVLAGSLFLPESVALLDLPLIAAIEKERITYLCALIGIFTYHKRTFLAARPGRGPEAVFLLVVLALLGTWQLNTEPMINYDRTQEALGIYWVVVRSVEDLLTFVVPFVVGRIAFQSREDLRTLAYALVAGGLVYVPLIILEAAMSILFRVWHLSPLIYGVSLGGVVQRWGEVQPVVFMDNALSLASFMAVATIMAAAFAASKSTAVWRGIRRAHLLTQLGLLLTRVTSSNLYGLALGLGLRAFKPAFSARLAVMIAAFVCAYPLLRLADLFPYEWVVQLAHDLINEERARSFEGRFLEEDFVFEGLGSRVGFGWGMFDRIPGAATFGVGEVGLDSYLIIRIGLTGVLGTELVFLFLMIPVWVAWRNLRFVADRESQFLMAGLMLCIAARMTDFLLNGLWNYLPFFLAGALYGIAKSTSRPDAGWALPVDAGLIKGPRQRAALGRGAVGRVSGQNRR